MSLSRTDESFLDVKALKTDINFHEYRKIHFISYIFACSYYRRYTTNYVKMALDYGK